MKILLDENLPKSLRQTWNELRCENCSGYGLAWQKERLTIGAYRIQRL